MRILLIFTLLYSITGGVRSFSMIGYSGGNIIIYCHYDNNYISNKKYFCMEKKYSSSCKDNIRTSVKDTWYHSGRYSLYDDIEENYFIVVIRQLTRQDEGTYWCAVDKFGALDSYTKVELKVKEDKCCKNSVTERACLGGEATLICNYPEDHVYNTKYLTKELHGYTISIQNSTLGRYSVLETTERRYTVTISNLTEDDTGTFWCGLETRKEGRYIALITPMKLCDITAGNTAYTISSQSTRPPTTSSSTMVTTKSSTTSSSSSSLSSSSTSQLSSGSTVIMLACVSVVVLLIVVILIIVYRWKYNQTTGSVFSTQRESSDRGNNYEGCHGDDEYEEIKEPPLESETVSATTTIYATATLPRNTSDSVHYASVNFNKNLGYHKEVTASISKEKPSSSIYATVEGGQSSTYSIVNHPQE
ncbi:hypothetical protein UPYG_G00059140 [Umbra pygmaea]|uniref:Ig-like domain-containing protein n=1 Tax=Umbra pygmaea TaxID=75934 RepID=A0ABD0X961_UMBPY